MTMNGHWGYNKNDQNWKSTTDLVRNLIDCTSKGGNYLLNVGPTSEGLFPGPSIERLAQIGNWMKLNGESIYGTTASPFKKLAWGKCTQKPGRLYLHVFNWPTDGKLLVPIGNAIKKASLLAKAGDLKTEKSDEGQVILLPSTAPDAISSVIAVDIEGAPQVLAASAALKQAADGSLSLPAAEGICHGDQIRYEEGSNHDNIGFWLNPSDWVEWQFKVTRPGKYTVIANLASQGTGAFELNLGEQTIKATAPNTGDYGKYQQVELGSLELKAPGDASLSVKAIRDDWAPFNIRTIALKPTK